LVLLVLATTPATVSAQKTLSARAGASLATLGGSDSGDLGSRTGLHLGAAITFPLSPSLGLQVGGAFVQKGAATSEDGVDVTVALDYIEIPVLLRLGVPMAGSLAPHFFLGPALSIEAGCEFEGSGDGATITISCSEADIPAKSIDIGGVAGAGLDIATSGPISVTLDVLFNFGLTSIDDSGSPSDIKNRAWSLLAGVDFPIG